VYAFFERWLNGRDVGRELDEFEVKPRETKELIVAPEGQVNVGLRSIHLFEVACQDFRRREPSVGLKELLKLDPEFADFRSTELITGKKKILVCINGNETPGWQTEKAFVTAIEKAGHGMMVIDPRGVGALRSDLQVKGRDYADPLVGVEENIAYNAFLVGKSLLGMRVTDVLAAVKQIREKVKPARLVVCGRADSALVVCLAAALDHEIEHLALEGLPLSLIKAFKPDERPFNAASILPNMLRDYGNIVDVLTTIDAWKTLLVAPVGNYPPFRRINAFHIEQSVVKDPTRLVEWLH
jgi:hypothetical protein